MVCVLVHSDGLEMIGRLKSWVDNRTNTNKFFSDDFLTLLLIMQITAFGGDIEHVLQFAYGKIL